MNLLTSPCKNCENREIGCHDRCVDYKTWAQERIKQKETFRAEKEALNFTLNMISETKSGRARKTPKKRNENNQ